MKGGTLQCFSSLSESTGQQICLKEGDVVYPICSGGVCRSQALWGMLQPFADQIDLLKPHAARVGWDPYNGQINRYRNYALESVSDEFELYFGFQKALRFGFENTEEWKLIEQSPTSEGLDKISQFYDQHYFSGAGANDGKRRLFIAFSNNAHVVLYRLNQTNENLEQVTVIAIESEDLISIPPSFLETTSRSTLAYDYFTRLLYQVFDFSGLHPMASK